MAEQAGSGALRRRRSRNSARSTTAKPAGESVRREPRLVAGFDIAGARERGFPVDELAKLKAQSRYLGSYAWELNLDPHDLCPLCSEMLGGWCLHADHVMPEHFEALYRLGDKWQPARDAEDVPEDAEVYHAVQCAAYAHAPCNLSKGRTADVSAWRLPVGARNSVVAGQAALRYSLMRPPQRVAWMILRCCGPLAFGGLVDAGGR